MATAGIPNIQIHVGIYYRELVNQKVVILANSEPFTKTILQRTLGMRSMFTLFNQNFQFTAEVIQQARVNALTEKSFSSHHGLRFQQVFFFVLEQTISALTFSK